MEKLINYSVGIVLLFMGLYCFIFPDNFMNAYDIVLSTAQSKTEIRTLSGFSSIIGYLFLYFTHKNKKQKNILFASFMVTIYFVIARITGLLIDGFSQTGTYYELSFEILAMIVIGIVYLKGNEK